MAAGSSLAPAVVKPAPFNAGSVKIALAQNSGVGDYFQKWTSGATQQANAVGFEMQKYDAQADKARQVTDMQTAIGLGVKGIIVDHGNVDTMCPPNAVFTSQNDESLASIVLTQAATDLGEGVRHRDPGSISSRASRTRGSQGCARLCYPPAPRAFDVFALTSCRRDSGLPSYALATIRVSPRSRASWRRSFQRGFLDAVLRQSRASSLHRRKHAFLESFPESSRQQAKPISI